MWPVWEVRSCAFRRLLEACKVLSAFLICLRPAIVSSDHVKWERVREQVPPAEWFKHTIFAIETIQSKQKEKDKEADDEK